VVWFSFASTFQVIDREDRHSPMWPIIWDVKPLTKQINNCTKLCMLMTKRPKINWLICIEIKLERVMYIDQVSYFID